MNVTHDRVELVLVARAKDDTSSSCRQLNRCIASDALAPTSEHHSLADERTRVDLPCMFAHQWSRERACSNSEQKGHRSRDNSVTRAQLPRALVAYATVSGGADGCQGLAKGP
jgi:hypothetical protein